MRRTASLLVWFALLEGFWALLVGTQQDTELVGGLGAAALGAVFAELLRTKGLLAYTTDFRLLARLVTLPWRVVRAFGIVTLALVQGRSGAWVEEAAPDEPWGRAFTAVEGSVTPNAVVVDVGGGRKLVHEL